MNRRRAMMIVASLLSLAPAAGAAQGAAAPTPPGALVDIGGQRLHVHCTGQGSPTVLLEAGTGDFSFVWALVQPGVSRFTRVCSYDRGGYAWSDPGASPRTFAQLALELHTALERLRVGPPYVVVGQSYGGLAIRGFIERYRREVVGAVFVDAVHEDQHIVYGGSPHLIRESAKGRAFPAPHIALDTAMLRAAKLKAPLQAPATLDAPLDRLPAADQALWRWAEVQPVVRLAQPAETDWSPEELARMHQQRLANRATFDSLPIIVLARTHGEYDSGVSISADSLERERRALAADLAKLSSQGTVRYAKNSGHNIHIEEPELVIGAIREIVMGVRKKH